MLSASHWLLAQARSCGRTHLPPSPNSTTSTGQGDIPISSTGCTCFNIHHIHSTCGHGDISAITLLIISLCGCSCLNIQWYTAPVDMMTFRWLRRSYQSICQQHPPYSHPQIMLIYYNTSSLNYSVKRRSNQMRNITLSLPLSHFVMWPVSQKGFQLRQSLPVTQKCLVPPKSLNLWNINHAYGWCVKSTSIHFKLFSTRRIFRAHFMFLRNYAVLDKKFTLLRVNSIISK